MTESPQKSFLGIGKILMLLVLGLVVYGVTLVFQVPAGWLWHKASAGIELPPQVEVQKVSGSLWRGAAGLNIGGFPVRVHWHLDWPSVTELTLPLEFSLSSSQSRLAGLVRAGWPATFEVTGEGIVTVSEFESLIRQSGGAMIDGAVTIDAFRLAWADNRLQQAQGVGHWPGGLVTWPMGSGTGQARFPPMEADLNTRDEGVALRIAEQGASGPAALASVARNGMMDIRVYKRMVDLAGQPWADSASPDDLVFRVQQPLLPGGF
ncbi:MAG TPA: type II secretion system protein N [Marinobacter sp.]|nr:type II secretion system protein N [Marinobacter sp.]